MAVCGIENSYGIYLRRFARHRGDIRGGIVLRQTVGEIVSRQCMVFDATGARFFDRPEHIHEHGVRENSSSASAHRKCCPSYQRNSRTIAGMSVSTASDHCASRAPRRKYVGRESLARQCVVPPLAEAVTACRGGLTRRVSKWRASAADARRAALARGVGSRQANRSSRASSCVCRSAIDGSHLATYRRARRNAITLHPAGRRSPVILAAILMRRQNRTFARSYAGRKSPAYRRRPAKASTDIAGIRGWC